MPTVKNQKFDSLTQQRGQNLPSNQDPEAPEKQLFQIGMSHTLTSPSVLFNYKAGMPVMGGLLFGQQNEQLFIGSKEKSSHQGKESHKKFQGQSEVKNLQSKFQAPANAQIQPWNYPQFYATADNFTNREEHFAGEPRRGTTSSNSETQQKRLWKTIQRKCSISEYSNPENMFFKEGQSNSYFPSKNKSPFEFSSAQAIKATTKQYKEQLQRLIRINSDFESQQEGLKVQADENQRTDAPRKGPQKDHHLKFEKLGTGPKVYFHDGISPTNQQLFEHRFLREPMSFQDKKSTMIYCYPEAPSRNNRGGKKKYSLILDKNQKNCRTEKQSVNRTTSNSFYDDQFSTDTLFCSPSRSPSPSQKGSYSLQKVLKIKQKIRKRNHCKMQQTKDQIYQQKLYLQEEDQNLKLKRLNKENRQTIDHQKNGRVGHQMEFQSPDTVESYEECIKQGEIASKKGLDLLGISQKQSKTKSISSFQIIDKEKTLKKKRVSDSRDQSCLGPKDHFYHKQTALSHENGRRNKEFEKVYTASSKIVYGGGSNLKDKALLHKHKARVLNDRKQENQIRRQKKKAMTVGQSTSRIPHGYDELGLDSYEIKIISNSEVLRPEGNVQCQETEKNPSRDLNRQDRVRDLSNDYKKRRNQAQKQSQFLSNFRQFQKVKFMFSKYPLMVGNR